MLRVKTWITWGHGFVCTPFPRRLLTYFCRAWPSRFLSWINLIVLIQFRMKLTRASLENLFGQTVKNFSNGGGQNLFEYKPIWIHGMSWMRCRFQRRFCSANIKPTSPTCVGYQKIYKKVCAGRLTMKRICSFFFSSAERPLACRPSECDPVAFDESGILVAKNAFMEQDVMRKA